MAVLTPQQRNTLEAAVKQARKVAELGAFNALHSMAVDHPEPFAHMTPEQRGLRNNLRSKARLLGDPLPANGAQKIDHLGYELAYETWHKMLFAKFLEANGLLMHTDGVAVTMEDCEELAPEEGFVDKWDAAANYASKMLPAIFRTNDPLMQVAYATEERIKLETIIDALENQIFIADDALGWVYQFWQSDAKAAINASGEKIDGEKLPAVTQLFTEPYMVHFLIDNTLGAWWVSRNPGIKPPVKFEYLRFLDVNPKVDSKVDSASSRINNDNENDNDNSLRQDGGVTLSGATLGGVTLGGATLGGATLGGDILDDDSLRQDGGVTFGGVTLEATFFNKYEEVDHFFGNLPHWRQEGKMYFVTFRTGDSMPQEKLIEWQEEMEVWKANNPEPLSQERQKEYYKRFSVKMQEYLDAGYGACHLKNENIKNIVEKALKFFEGERYVLDEFVVAANHVHVIVQPKGDHQLSDILHSWKSFTANEINKAIGEKGTFWQKESFDHLVRNEASLNKFREYIQNHNNLNTIVDSKVDSKVDSASSRINNDNDNSLRQDGGATLGGVAAGKFEGWPDKTAEVNALDPCMGSGHFVASLFPVFAALRMHEEGLTKEEATDKVITENLNGLELDARCTQIAAFNLALTAWKFCGHYKELPEMNLACSGIAPKGKVEDWVKLVGKVERVEDKARMENGMRVLYEHFQLAPELGSLLDPTTIKADAFTASFEELQPILKRALENEVDTEQLERGVMAAGIAKAGQLLGKKYTLQITNVPYLSRGKQDKVMSDYCEKNYPEAKGDLATVFLEKMLKANSKGGISCSVIPQNWLFLTSYKKFREKLLKNETWSVIARLGAKSFQTPMWDFNVMLISLYHAKPSSQTSLTGLDVSDAPNASGKDEALKATELKMVRQLEQLGNPDARIVMESQTSNNLLNQVAFSHHGLVCGDRPRMCVNFWEVLSKYGIWIHYCGTVKKSIPFGGKENYLRWCNGKGAIKELKGATNLETHAWDKRGVVISAMGALHVTLYTGMAFDNNTAVITPNDPKDLSAIWCFCSSPHFNEEVRKIDQSLKVTNSTLVKVPFDLAYWQKVAAEKYPNGLPKPYSDDPTQWLFHGHPIKTENPLQVALARVLGYRWPAEEVNNTSAIVEAASSGFQKETNSTDSGDIKNNAAGSSIYDSVIGTDSGDIKNNAAGSSIYYTDAEASLTSIKNNAAGSSIYDTLADEAKDLIHAVKAFDHLSDEDGIFCIPSVNAEQAGAERLREYLQTVFAGEWNNQTITQLLRKVEAASSSLDDYLRNEFFSQHCKLFQNRPFIWHIWDGRKDGFSALVNYHKLDKDNLSKLIYTYLNDWIRVCVAKKNAGESGAEGLLSAAQKLKENLEAILNGEAPYDIFVRWKSLAEQPMGWEPDLNDGVRLNIRPFVEAGVLRNKFNVKWGVDRGKNPPGSYWGEIRDNDKHLSLEEKREAREKIKK